MNRPLERHGERRDRASNESSEPAAELPLVEPVADVQPIPTGDGPAPSPEEYMRQQAGRLYSQGMTLKEVGEALGCSLPRARKLVHEAGVPIRRPGTGRKQRSKGLERVPGLTWLPADDEFMVAERRRMLRYLVERKELGWRACRDALEISDDVLAEDLEALGLALEPELVAPDDGPDERRSKDRRERPRGRRLKDAEHLLEDLASMRSMQDQGMALADIARLFGLSVPTLKKRLAMTEAEVRAQLERE